MKLCFRVDIPDGATIDSAELILPNGLTLPVTLYGSMEIAEADPPMAGLREAEPRQWWQTLGLALQRQSAPRLDVLGISPGGVRARMEMFLRERQGWERWELFIEAVFDVGENAFVEMVGANRDG